MRFLARRIELEQTLRRVNRSFAVLGIKKPLQNIYHQIVHARALDEEPVFELVIGKSHALKELATIEFRGVFQFAGFDQLTELNDVDADDVPVEGHCFSGSGHGSRFTQAVAQLHQGFPQAAPRSFLVPISP
jgi:hypothetical protein